MIERTLLERQAELMGLRTSAAYLVEQINGKATAWLDADLEKLEWIAARLAGEFSDLNGKGFADEIRSQLKVERKTPNGNGTGTSS